MDRKIYEAQEKLYARILAGDSEWSSSVHAKAKIDFLARINLSQPIQSVLLLGCGDGSYAFHLSSLAKQVYGIDISEKGIELANRRNDCKNISFVCADILELELPQAPFSLIVDDYCYHCQVGEQRIKFLNRVRSWLAPGGHFLMQVVLPESGNTEYQELEGVQFRQFEPESALEKELESGGFRTLTKEIRAPEGQSVMYCLAGLKS
ncbi:MAG: class I SAM-dependent methyltransferase [Pseudomonadota bacterium]